MSPIQYTVQLTPGAEAVARKVARRLYSDKSKPALHITRRSTGDVPLPLQKQWQKLLQHTRVAHDQASTPASAAELAERLNYMQSAGLGIPDEDNDDGLQPLAALRQYAGQPVRAPTLYYRVQVSMPGLQEACHILAVWTPRSSIVIGYQPNTGRFLEAILPATH